VTAASNDRDPLEDFLALSVALTGYGRADLLGTGVARRHYDEAVRMAGEAVCRDLLDAAAAACAAGDDVARREEALRQTVLAEPKLGPVARSIIKMWYLGAWREPPGDRDHVVSAEAYQEGLVWRAIGSHPPGAKQPGFGTWALEPSADTD
jgi:hypothetical protein